MEDSLDMPVYKTTVHIAFRENWHVSTEAQLIINKFQVHKILRIQINVIDKRKDNVQNRDQNVYFPMRICNYEAKSDTESVF